MNSKKGKLSKDDFPLSLKIKNLGKIKKECKFFNDIEPKSQKNNIAPFKKEETVDYFDTSGWESEIKGVKRIEESQNKLKIDEIFLVFILKTNCIFYI